jgi:hypothetical protein
LGIAGGRDPVGGGRNFRVDCLEAMDILTANKAFELWVGRHISLVPSQLADKHRLMAESPVGFLRGTFYRWTQMFPDICQALNRAPRVLSVGDLHIASFGTWRDAFGRLIWGIDDFDEAHPLPYTNDLVRLGVSAVLDASEGEIKVNLRNVDDVIVSGYTSGLKEGGKPFVLEESHKWLRSVALKRLDVPAKFWKKMDALPTIRDSPPAGARKAIDSLLPSPRPACKFVRRTAGTGSLGHPRYVAIANWCGAPIALEAKAAVPSACVWARPDGASEIYYQAMLDRAIRCPDPFVKLSGKWLIRHLAPDSSPIDIESMSGKRDEDRLLEAMAAETANVHLGTKGAAKRILLDIGRRPADWLRSSIKEMSTVTIDEWREWKKAHRLR